MKATMRMKTMVSGVAPRLTCCVAHCLLTWDDKLDEQSEPCLSSDCTKRPTHRYSTPDDWLHVSPCELGRDPGEPSVLHDPPNRDRQLGTPTPCLRLHKGYLLPLPFRTLGSLIFRMIR